MKYITFIVVPFFLLLLQGCATWDGVKKDTSDAYNSTKEAIHDATE